MVGTRTLGWTVSSITLKLRVEPGAIAREISWIEVSIVNSREASAGMDTRSIQQLDAEADRLNVLVRLYSRTALVVMVYYWLSIRAMW